MNALDTNLWIYRHDTRDSVKQDVARRLIEEARPWVLPWQVGCEFLAAARKLEPQGLSKDDAWAALADMQIIASAILLPEPQPGSMRAPSRSASCCPSGMPCWLPPASEEVSARYTPKTSAPPERSKGYPS